MRNNLIHVRKGIVKKTNQTNKQTKVKKNVSEDVEGKELL
jgi:hypothetical protein